MTVVNLTIGDGKMGGGGLRLACKSIEKGNVTHSMHSRGLMKSNPKRKDRGALSVMAAANPRRPMALYLI